jgi:hypothetical protein
MRDQRFGLSPRQRLGTGSEKIPLRCRVTSSQDHVAAPLCLLSRRCEQDKCACRRLQRRLATTTTASRTVVVDFAGVQCGAISIDTVPTSGSKRAQQRNVVIVGVSRQQRVWRRRRHLGTTPSAGAFITVATHSPESTGLDDCNGIPWFPRHHEL